MRALVAPASLALLPLVLWPGLVHPFSRPKLAFMAAVVAGALLMPGSGGRVRLALALRWCAFGWVATFVVAAVAAGVPAIDPLLLGVMAPLLPLALLRGGASPVGMLAGMAVGASACAAVALLQWVGQDPFGWIGWDAPVDGASVRMRVYGTLGNPNFVGALMAMSLPLTAAVHREGSSRWHRRLAEVAVAMQALAIVATGSRGAVLGLGAAAAVYASLRWSRRVRLAVAGLIVFAALAVASSPARPLDTTVAGRVHLWRIAARHAAAAPVTGQGPGAVTRQFPNWQRVAARTGVRDPRFAGPTDHVHNDYLEALIERGVPGLLALIVPLGLAVVQTARRCPAPISPVAAGACAALTAGAACALVDYPLARPTELAWWWVALAIALQSAGAPMQAGPESRAP